VSRGVSPCSVTGSWSFRRLFGQRAAVRSAAVEHGAGNFPSRSARVPPSTHTCTRTSASSHAACMSFVHASRRPRTDPRKLVRCSRHEYIITRTLACVGMLSSPLRASDVLRLGGRDASLERIGPRAPQNCKPSPRLCSFPPLTSPGKRVHPSTDKSWRTMINPRPSTQQDENVLLLPR